jgi:glycosyltransferase involved in cell wall biosynthesis
LQLYYKRKKLPVLLIPPLVDAKKSELLSNEHKLNAESSFLNLIYAGFPGKKDMLPLMVTAVEELNLNNIKVKLHIIGPSKQELIKFMSAELSENIICYGRVEQYLIPKYLSQADFSLLLRRQERYAEAGFPTKFVESMNCGLPVISNLTSDLHLYLKEGSNGFVLKDCTETAIIDKIKQITNCRSLIIQNMKVNAKNTAIENFDFRLYSNGLRNFCFDS